jgi:hypothetical protein
MLDRRENNNSFTKEISSYPELDVGISLPSIDWTLPLYQVKSRATAEVKSVAGMARRKENNCLPQVRDNVRKNKLFCRCQIMTQRSRLAFPSIVS